MMRTVLDGFALFEELLDFGSDDAVKHFMIRTFCQHENSLPKLYFLFCKNVLFVFPTIVFREFLGNVPRVFQNSSESFFETFREIFRNSHTATTKQATMVFNYLCDQAD